MRTGILKSPVGNLRKVPDKAPSWRGELTDSCRNRCRPLSGSHFVEYGDLDVRDVRRLRSPGRAW